MSVELMPHNEKAYEGVKECYKKANICCVIQPPSTRKTSIALKLVEDNIDKKTLYLAPGSAILHQVKEIALDEGVYTAENFNRKTYQSLSKMSNEEIANLEVDIIVLDEFHHCGSPIWGEAVRRLIETHPNAKVLGLSATPIRYFDGNIDMAEELFKGNIASEISFEQAIEQEILEEFDYIVATYAIDFEKIVIDEMLSDGYVLEENKEVFDKLYEELKDRLGENVANLPDVLEKHIKQKSGKYVFFCKNLEDKEQQIKEAKKAFSKVNPNIKIYDIDYTHTDRENQRTIQSFRKATSDDGALKILFNVDMLVEGFHLPDLAGGFTTRPTKSPRIAIQEAGRILKTKKIPKKDIVENSQNTEVLSTTEDSSNTQYVEEVDDIRPVFIDFVDTLRQLDIIRSAITAQKTNIKRTRTEGKSHSEGKIRIYDTTIEIAEIVDKMKSLVVERTTIEEKVRYIEQYLQKSKKSSIAGNSVDEDGRPIGQWCIQIRSAITRGKAYNDKIMEKLKQLGILERQFDSTIDEKIDFMITFAKEYPELMKQMSYSHGIKNSAQERIKDEYVLAQIEQFNKYYAYVAHRLYEKKLSEDRFALLKEAGIGGRFNTYEENLGYDDIKSAEERTQKFVKDMIKKYGSIEEFEKNYIYELVNNPYFSKPSDYFIQSIDISSPNFMADPSYVDLVTAVHTNEVDRKLFKSYFVINSENVNNALELLPKEQAKILKLAYGLQGNKKYTLEGIRDELKLNITRSRVGQIKSQAEKKFRHATSRLIRKVLLNDDIGDSLYFLQDFINIYGIRKRESITPKMQEEIRSIYEKQLKLKNEIKRRSREVEYYATLEEKMQMLRNIFGDRINSDFIENHFLNQTSIQLEEGSKDYERRIDKIFLRLLPMVVMDERNRDYIERFEERDLISDKLRQQFKYVSDEYSEYTRGYKDIYKIVTMPVSSLEYEMYNKTEYVQKVRKILEKYNLHYEMSDDEIKIYIANHENMIDGIAKIEELDVSEDSITILSSLGITTIEDFKSVGRDKLMKINSDINESIDRSINQKVSINELDLSYRACKYLHGAGIHNVDQLDNIDEQHLMSISYIEDKSLDEIKKKLELFKNENVDAVAIMPNIDEETREKVARIIRTSEDRVSLRNSVYYAILEVEKKYKLLLHRAIWQENENSSLLDKPIEDMEFSCRTYNCLSREGIKTLREFDILTEEEQKKIRNFGKKSFDEVMEKIEEIKLAEYTDEEIEAGHVHEEKKVSGGDLPSEEGVEKLTNEESDDLDGEQIDFTNFYINLENTTSLFTSPEEICAIEEAGEAEKADILEDIDVDHITDKKKADEILIDLVNNIRFSYSQIQSRIQEISEIGRAIDAQIIEINQACQKSKSDVNQLDKFLKENKKSLGSYAKEIEAQLEEARKILSTREEQRKALEKQKAENDANLNVATKEKSDIEKIAEDNNLEL